MAGPARNTNTIVDELLKFKRERAKGFGLARQQFSGVSYSASSGGAGSKGSPDITGGEAYLKTGGDTMIGPIAYYPKAATIAAGVLDVGVESSGFSSRVIVSGEGAADDDLNTISNVAHAGQMLFLQPIITNTITLKHNVDNIFNPQGTDVVVAGGQTVVLQWDTVVHANKWVVLTGNAISGAGDNLGNHIATLELDMANNNIVSNTAPTGGDQFRIIFDAHEDSDTYVSNLTTVDTIQVVASNTINAEFRPTENYFDKNLNMNLNVIHFGASSATTGLIRMVNSTDLRWGAAPSNVDREGSITYDVDENMLFTASGQFEWYIGDAVKSNVMNLSTTGIDLLGNTLDNVHENTIINATTAVAVDGANDWLLIADVDGAGTEWFKIHPNDLGVGGDDLGNHTATQDIEMANNNIESTTAPTGINQFRIIFDAHEDRDTYIANTTTNDVIQIVTANTILAEFRPTELYIDDPLNMNLNNINWGSSSATTGLIRMVNNTDLRWAASPSNVDREGIISYDVDENMDFTASGVHRFWIGDAIKSQIAEFTTSGLDMQDNDITNWNDLVSGSLNPAAIGGLRLATAERVAWRNSDNTADLFIENTGTNSLHVSGNWLPTSGSTFDLGTTGTRWSDVFSVGGDFSGTLLVAGQATFNGDVFLGNAAGDEVRIRGICNFVEIAEPVTPATNEATIFVDSADGIAKIKKDTGSVVSLEGAGGSSFADNVFEVFDDITSTKKIQFSLATATGTNLFAIFGTSDTYTFPDGGGTVVMTQGTQTIGGAKTFSTTFTASSTANFNGTVNMNSHVNLGNGTTDNISVNGRVNTDVDPDATNTYDLGSTTLRWDIVYSTTFNVDAGGVTNTAIDIADSGGIIKFDGNAISVTASAGSVTPPSQVVGYINCKVGGTNYRIPYYLT
jgi:hypothetical protein